MRPIWWSLAVLLVAAMPAARAQDGLSLTGGRQYFPPPGPNCCPPPYPAYPIVPGTPGMPGYPGSPTEPGKLPDGTTPEPKLPSDVTQPQGPTDQFAQAGEAGAQQGGMFNQNMFGDLIGIAGSRVVFTPSPFGGTPVAHTTRAGIGITTRYQGLKITDNDSPRPIDRVFFSYNYFYGLNNSINPPGTPRTNLSREIIGFEKTFLGGNASYQMRLPFLQENGAASTHDLGDLTMIFKYAVINNRQTGNVLSGGMALTVPTGGRAFEADAGLPVTRSVIFQPWGGFIYNMPSTFVQGFSSIIVPTNNLDPTIFFNSLGLGWWAWRNPADRFITGVVPVAEIHVNTPLNHRSPNDVIFFQDQVNLTVGSYFLFPRMTVGGAVCTPLVGPKPYDIEAIANVSFRF